MRICLIELVDGSNPALYLRSEFRHHHRQRIALHVERYLVYQLVAILEITNDTLPRALVTVRTLPICYFNIHLIASTRDCDAILESFTLTSRAFLSSIIWGVL